VLIFRRGGHDKVVEHLDRGVEDQDKAAEDLRGVVHHQGKAAAALNKVVDLKA